MYLAIPAFQLSLGPLTKPIRHYLLVEYTRKHVFKKSLHCKPSVAVWRQRILQCTLGIKDKDTTNYPQGMCYNSKQSSKCKVHRRVIITKGKRVINSILNSSSQTRKPRPSLLCCSFLKKQRPN